MKRILVIDDDASILDNVLELLGAEGFDGVGASDGKEGVAEALRQRPDLIICDVGMPVLDGHQVLQRIRDYPETASVPFMFLTARASRADLRAGMTLGADDYLTKPFSRRELLDAIAGRFARHRTLGVATAPDISQGGDDELSPIVASTRLEAVYDEARRAARSDLPILILGETGVGKDVLAHHIHKSSPRALQPFVPLNCAALSDTLLESELFGHEKGSFTGASSRRSGLFEMAEGGTVFLDEIGDLPAATQVKLLRVLEDHKVMRVGGREYIDIDVRFVSATNQDLQSDDGNPFRSDLFYRIGVIVLTVPPLRERVADLRPLAKRFARGMSERMGWSSQVRIDEDALDELEKWSWPGNVRELRNVVERAVAMSDGSSVSRADLPRRQASTPAGTTPEGLQEAIRHQQRSLERARILDALEVHGGNQTRAAAHLGISRRTLINRLDEFGLPRPRKDP